MPHVSMKMSNPLASMVPEYVAYTSPRHTSHHTSHHFLSMRPTACSSFSFERFTHCTARSTHSVDPWFPSYWNTDDWVPPPEVLIQQVLGEAWKSAFLTLPMYGPRTTLWESLQGMFVEWKNDWRKVSLKNSIPPKFQKLAIEKSRETILPTITSRWGAKNSRKPEKNFKYQKNSRVTIWFSLSPYCITSYDQTRNLKYVHFSDLTIY